MITNTAKQFKETAIQFGLKGAEKEKSVINDWCFLIKIAILLFDLLNFCNLSEKKMVFT